MLWLFVNHESGGKILDPYSSHQLQKDPNVKCEILTLLEYRISLLPLDREVY